ncbi:hypothetical protein [Streptomyces sp. NBC_01750]|uniref:hypothetical protein n=1 Tax=Streptomyces sp. NBC_01750 TaxID=2975928 RepID=UPI002DDA0453|nr:hypothetical protein [Streptomyces sp. NBC_01750]WSD37770.1 hypothetical protein OG966_16415 [Streptomyces sp. NBC_01750]
MAWGDEETGSLAVDELGDRVCAMGFVVAEATAPAVPFLLELAGAPSVRCKAELLDLLTRILTAKQWSEAAAAAGPGSSSYKEQPGWEVASRQAVLAGRHVVEGLADAVRPGVAAAAARLLCAFDDVSSGSERATEGTWKP